MSANVDPQTLVRQHLRWGRFTAARVVGTRGRVPPDVFEDITQASVLGLYYATERWDPARGAFTTWSAWCCKHFAQAELRTIRGPAPVVVRRLSADPEGHDPIAAFNEADEQRHRLAAVAAVLETWTADQRSLWTRYHLDGLTAQQIADERGCSHQAVSERLRGLMARMRQALGVTP